MPFSLYKLGQIGQELPMAAHGLKDAGHLSAGDRQLQWASFVFLEFYSAPCSFNYNAINNSNYIYIYMCVYNINYNNIVLKYYNFLFCFSHQTVFTLTHEFYFFFCNSPSWWGRWEIECVLFGCWLGLNHDKVTTKCQMNVNHMLKYWEISELNFSCQLFKKRRSALRSTKNGTSVFTSCMLIQNRENSIFWSLSNLKTDPNLPWSHNSSSLWLCKWYMAEIILLYKELLYFLFLNQSFWK